MSKQLSSDDTVSTHCPELDCFLALSSNGQAMNYDRFSMDYSKCDDYIGDDAKTIHAQSADDSSAEDGKQPGSPGQVKENRPKVCKNRSAYNLFVKDKVVRGSHS